MNFANVDLPQLIYLLMGLVVVASAAVWASRRAKAVGAKGPGVLSSLLVWGGLIALVMLLYQGVQLWTGAASLFGRSG